jgi:hypothetical protein
MRFVGVTVEQRQGLYIPQAVVNAICSEVKSHLGSHLLTPVTRLYTQHTNKHPEVASSNTVAKCSPRKFPL